MSFSQRAKVACLPDCELVKIDLSECDWLRLHDRQLQVVDSIIVLDLDRKRVDRHAENVAEEPYLAKRVCHDGLCRQDIERLGITFFFSQPEGLSGDPEVAQGSGATSSYQGE